MNEEISKAEFLIDFLCSELGSEVYKNSVREVNANDRPDYLINFASGLWKHIQEEKDNEEKDNEWKYE
jgi:hypothetical protein